MDKLKTPAPQFYSGNVMCVKKIATTHGGLDDAGKFLLHEACRQETIAQAKTHNFLRRTALSPNCTRDKEKRQMYLENFEQIGPRWVKDAHEVNDHMEYTGWYTDSYCNEVLTGVVVCMTRHGEGEDSYNVYKAKGRVIYMAGTRHSDWDGVTLDLDTTDDPDTAARWADSMAEREAESYREEDERYQAEQEAA